MQNDRFDLQFQIFHVFAYLYKVSFTFFLFKKKLTKYNVYKRDYE